MESMLLPLLVLLAGFILIGLELFVPAVGAIRVIASLCIVSAILLGFWADARTGLLMILIAAVLLPVSIIVLRKIWPHSPMGKRPVVKKIRADEVLPNDEYYQNLKQLVGRRGVAKSKMLPSGSVRIDGKNYDAVCDGMAVDEGQKIEVIAIRTNRIIVRPVLTRELDVQNTEDILAQSPDALGIENWEEPLADFDAPSTDIAESD